MLPSCPVVHTYIINTQLWPDVWKEICLFCKRLREDIEDKDSETDKEIDKEIIEYAKSKWFTCEKVRIGKYMFYWNGIQFINRPVYYNDKIKTIKDQIDFVYYNVKCDSETTQ